MQQTSQLYKTLLASPVHFTELKVEIGGRVYREDVLSTVDVKAALFSGDEPTVGTCVSRELSMRMLRPADKFSGLEKMSVFVRLSDGEQQSEWLPHGVYFIDTMDEDAEEDGVIWLNIHGYDAILFTEQEYPANSNLSWPARDTDVLKDMAAAVGIEIDRRTLEIMSGGYLLEYPGEYTVREVLGYIAAMYGGTFTTSEDGKFLLVCFWDIPKDTSYLVTNEGYPITFGGVRIFV